MANRMKITMTGARAFAAADGREAVLWDSAAPGLGLRARPNGRQTWIVHRRCNGSVVRRTLGALDALTVDDARHAARALIADAETGGAAAAVPTVRTFLADCAERWKPTTRETYAHTVRRWILPAFGGRPVDAIGAKDVRNWHDDIAATRPGSAHWALAAMSSMMKHAEALGLRREDSNPCKGLRRRKTGFEAHYLTDDEFAALGRALDGAEADHPVGRSDKKSGRPFRFILNNSKATAANVYLMLYPKEPFERALVSNSDLKRRVWEYLNQICPQAMLGEGRVYGGGLHKLEPRELGNVPAEALVELFPASGWQRLGRQGELFEGLVV